MESSTTALCDGKRIQVQYTMIRSRSRCLCYLNSDHSPHTWRTRNVIKSWWDNRFRWRSSILTLYDRQMKEPILRTEPKLRFNIHAVVFNPYWTKRIFILAGLLSLIVISLISVGNSASESKEEASALLFISWFGVILFFPIMMGTILRLQIWLLSEWLRIDYLSWFRRIACIFEGFACFALLANLLSAIFILT